MDKATRKHLARIVHELSQEVYNALDRVEKFLQKAIEAESCGDVVSAGEWFIKAIGQEFIAIGKMAAVEAHSLTLSGGGDDDDE